MFKNKRIEEVQQWNGQKISFDPDSSPEAWKHYKKYYKKNGECILGDYNFKKLFFYNHFNDIGLKHGLHKNNCVWLNYTNNHKNKYNRLFALNNNTALESRGNIEYCGPSSRLGGECDFNFNEQKRKMFELIICGNDAAAKKLIKCSELHHTLINFSLIQGMGNMQSDKGRNKYDRLDVFVHVLSEYFNNPSNITNCSSSKNKEAVISYLNSFKNIYDYMERVYFINSERFINKIIEQGKLEINTCDDVIRYMDLAIEFWDNKQKYFEEKDKTKE